MFLEKVIWLRTSGSKFQGLVYHCSVFQGVGDVLCFVAMPSDPSINMI